MRPNPLYPAARRAKLEALRVRAAIRARRGPGARRLLPHARFLHIHRDRADVIDSIGRIGSGQKGCRVLGRGDYNQWWGSRHAKWSALLRERPGPPELGELAPRLATHADRGTYEWLASLHEGDRSRAPLGDDWLDIRSRDLATEPRSQLTRVAAWLGLDPLESWLDQATAEVEAAPPPAGVCPVHPDLVDMFNGMQARLGHTRRAIAASADHPPER